MLHESRTFDGYHNGLNGRNKNEKVKLIDCNILLSCAYITSTKMLHNFMIISMLQLLCFTNKNADFMRVKINCSSRGGY